MNKTITWINKTGKKDKIQLYFKYFLLKSTRGKR